LCITRKLTI